ncbi:hypothetical protein H109_06805 [Trichophyton interdigitale MR816]|uniref:Uncharacterized protein n=1 Tax=Trichophyton interdigitale (strain MR816) TaxID=1215338 RepID=A0A059J081_TRIIM|nr:hypothetical protein H101_02339 [Trichophyton interdigitale H6]KDB21281.1 hypothetical protein H109_06805 [Trichophyton interdigitale MR816]
MEAGMTSSAHQVPSRDTGGMSAGQAISRGPVKRSWSFPRVFGMRFNRQVDQPPVLVSEGMETAGCSVHNTQNSYPSPGMNSRGTWNSFRFFSRQKPSAVPDFSETPLRRAKSAQGFFAGTFKTPFFKRASVVPNQDDRNESNGDDPGFAGSDSNHESDVLSTFAPIHPEDSLAVQSSGSLGETHDSQQLSEETRETILEENKSLLDPTSGSSTRSVILVPRRLINYFRKNRSLRSHENPKPRPVSRRTSANKPLTQRDIAQKHLLEESLFICPKEFPMAAQRLMRGGITANSSCVASLSAVSRRGHGRSTISLSLTASSSRLPTHLRYMVEAIDRPSAEQIIESTSDPP